ncbi:non-hydrolyzing UDP-N-acetylglucosamine 2-epimerase [Nocardioides marmoribigeumensis]|uniref:UDP-N-acetylglucosamine 2-epimerase (non-hydrolyzing) n=1 Tax=Nocardioides marmoribigeumensis TaxID=433649 RepID=A0ABU2BW97_9ACTN|nr:UDP-N-acetylglucosamine 2-epimerase (non-hydrolyzing) [Nocardioides marmoribigeumensis]MDR7361993.1 UDP-N-acetylglucosamine 2-epimerase (non-hydrolyzing) [Nocardioides marmoribigeumensis]
MKRVMVVYGTRPEAIKVAPVIERLRSAEGFEVVPVVTGQHREMLDQVNELFGIVPAIDLDVMVPGAGLADLSSRALKEVGSAIADVRPDVVMVQGDTSTAAMAAIASFYGQVPVVHIEAGLRTGNLESPFPEEANRRLISPLAALHLAPTATSRANLLREAIPDDAVTVTGNTVIDALLWAVERPVEFTDKRIDEMRGSGDPMVLVTAHRRESWGQPMADAMRGLRKVAESRPDVRWLIPMHRNPVVRDVLQAELGDIDQVLLTEPMSYHEFAHAMRASHLCLTDSGGVQEEAPSLGKPVLVMRDNTERPEAVDAGTVKLIGTDMARVADELDALLSDRVAYQSMANAVNPYGDGHAAARSVAAVAQLLGAGRRLAEFIPSTNGGHDV